MNLKKVEKEKRKKKKEKRKKVEKQKSRKEKKGRKSRKIKNINLEARTVKKMMKDENMNRKNLHNSKQANK